MITRGTSSRSFVPSHPVGTVNGVVTVLAYRDVCTVKLTGGAVRQPHKPRER